MLAALEMRWLFESCNEFDFSTNVFHEIQTLIYIQALLEFRAFDFREIWIFAVYEQPQLYICITPTTADLLWYSTGFTLFHNLKMTLTQFNGKLK